jgi:transcriptional regulator with XRE-family HTH domain
MADFSGRLRAARRAAKLSCRGLARATGLSRQGTRNLELPGSNPKLDTLLLLARALGVSLDALAGVAAPAAAKRGKK